MTQSMHPQVFLVVATVLHCLTSSSLRANCCIVLSCYRLLHAAGWTAFANEPGIPAPGVWRLLD